LCPPTLPPKLRDPPSHVLERAIGVELFHRSTVDLRGRLQHCVL
jgi:hypothetical protein